MKDIELVKIDYSSVDPKYRRNEKHVIADIPRPWIVPEEGPFYTAGIRVYDRGTLLTYEKDYVFDTPASELANLLGKDVYHYIELKDHVLTNSPAIDIEYQKVGDPLISRKTLIDALESMTINGGDIDFTTSVTGIPLTFPSAKHSMDVTKPEEVVGFGNLIQLFSLLSERMKNNGNVISKLLEKLQTDIFTKLDYIQTLQWGAIMFHCNTARNPHDLKPIDVQLEKLANYQTANKQQEQEGMRSDLYSTPKGIKEILETTEPDSEEYMFQNELPLSYYGSGIYLPPPITGSFEGLGGDVENSCFVREGNGWLVGLMRQFDGRTKRLNYIYQQLVLDRYNFSQMVVTYIPYQHVDFELKGINPEYIIAGSGPDILAITEWNNTANLMVSLSNGTLDPSSHSFVEVDMTPLRDMVSYPPTHGMYPGSLTISKVGDQVLLIQSYAEAEGAVNNRPNFYERENFTQIFYTFPISGLSVPGKPKIVPVLVPMTFDTVDRVRKTNQRVFRACDYKVDAQGLVTGALVDFSQPVTGAHSHRRRQFIVVENKDVPGVARVKMGCANYWTHAIGGGQGSSWSYIVIDYDLNLNNKTMLLSAGWKKPLVDIFNGQILNFNAAELAKIGDRNTVQKQGICSHMTAMFAYPASSWVPGLGPVFNFSMGTGDGPYGTGYLPLNTTGDPKQDYASMLNPTFLIDNRSNPTYWTAVLNTPSPFGVAGFPRFYSDIYEYNGKVNAKPIEQFCGEKDDQGRGSFNRMTEGGDGNDYKFRPELQSNFITGRIFGRQPNALVGKTENFLSSNPYKNWPQRRDKFSTTHCVGGLHYRPKTGLLYSTMIPSYNNMAIQIDQLDKVKERMVFPITYNWTYEENNKLLKANPRTGSDVIVMDKSQYLDWALDYIGPNRSKVMELLIHFDLSPLPGDLSPNVHMSTMMVVYSFEGSPEKARAFTLGFSWTANGIDSQTGFTKIAIKLETTSVWSNERGTYINPPKLDQTVDQDVAFSSGLFVQQSGYWSISLNRDPGSLTINRSHSEVYSFGPTANDIVSHTFTGFFIGTIGNMVCPNLFVDRRRRAGNPELYWPAINVMSSYPSLRVAVDGLGLLNGYAPANSGSAMNLVGTGRVDDFTNHNGFTGGDLAFSGATFVEGNWAFFINADVTVTFNGYSMTAIKKAFDVREYTDVYRNETFYLYCIARGSVAEYELSKQLRYSRGDCLLVGRITTDDFGIKLIDRFQPFAIAGHPITQVRGPGIPARIGVLTEQGSFKLLKRSELFNGY